MWIVALLSITLIALELAWTRLFSAEFFYTFAFLILSLAVLGLGLGALALRLFPRFDQQDRLPLLLILCAASALAGPPLVFLLRVDFAQLFSLPMLWRLLVTLGLLSGPYLCGGLALALLFKQGHARIDRLYMGDLLGAGAGVLLILVVMNRVGTPAAVFACALPVLLAALLTARRWLRLIPLLLLGAMIALALYAAPLLSVARPERAPVIYTHWDAVAKIKIYDYEGPFRGINIDNVANSPVYQFDGDWNRPDSLRFEFGIDVGWLIERLPGCRFVSLGAGGGVDVLQALQYGAAEVHAVEIIPHLNELMLNGELAEYSGHIYEDPRVVVATEDARAYVRRSPGKFDLIYSLSTNSWAALASGAFALAENYLFTTEAFRDYWRALSDRGFMMMEHQYYMPRLVAEALDALAAEEVTVPREHIAVYDLPAMRRKMILLSKRPLDEEIRTHAFGELTPEVADYIHLLFPAPDSLADNEIKRIVLEGWRAVAPQADYDLSAATDDRPYTAQMGLWRNFSWEQLGALSPVGEMTGFPLAKLVIVIVLLVAILIAVPLNLLPYLVSARRLRAAPWGYFFAIGMAYLMIEVILIQRYALLVGLSVYSLATILLTLLFFSGLGSRCARRVPDEVAFGAILVLLLLEILIWPAVTIRLGHLMPTSRILLAALLVAPLGFFMGMPFPKAGLRVGPLIDWGFAVNGTASVIGSALVMLVAFTQGFRVSLALAALLYLAAFGLFRWRRAW